MSVSDCPIKSLEHPFAHAVSELGDKVVVFSPVTNIDDLAKSMKSTDMKLKKRCTRMKCLADLFTIYAVSLCISLDDLTYIRHVAAEAIDDAERRLLVLEDEVQPFKFSDIFESSLNNPLFLRPALDAPQVQTAKQFFDGQMKDALNGDFPEIYHAMTAIAVVSFYEFTQVVPEDDEVSRALKKSAKLVFKGGAAIGHFLFKNKGLSEEHKGDLFKLFMMNGDNDTSIVFDDDLMSEPGMNRIDEHMLHCSQTIFLQDFMSCIKANFVRYQVEEWLENRARNATMFWNFDKEGLKLEASPYKHGNMMITNCGDGYKYRDTSREKSPVYFTFNKLEFSKDADYTCFVLGRAKYSYQIMDEDSGKRAAVSAELLDVSLSFSTSTKHFQNTYTRAFQNALCVCR